MAAGDVYAVVPSTSSGANRLRRRSGWAGVWDRGITPPSTNSSGMAFDPAGNLYVSDASRNRIYRRAGGYSGSSWDAGITPPSGVGGSIFGIAFDSAGNLYCVFGNFPNQRIYRRAGGYSGPSWDAGISTPGGTSIFGIAFDSAGNLYCVGGTNPDRIYRRTGGYSGSSWDAGVTPPSNSSYGIAFDADDRIYANNFGSGRIFRRTNYTTGVWNNDSITDGTTGSGVPRARAIAIEPAASTPSATTVLLNTPGAGNWVVPQNVRSLDVELVGGGGRGADAAVGGRGGAGRGGGDSTFGTLSAEGGGGGGAGGSSFNGFSGGAGGGPAGGGGGGAAQSQAGGGGAGSDGGSAGTSGDIGTRSGGGGNGPSGGTGGVGRAIGTGRGIGAGGGGGGASGGRASGGDTNIDGGDGDGVPGEASDNPGTSGGSGRSGAAAISGLSNYGAGRGGTGSTVQAQDGGAGGGGGGAYVRKNSVSVTPGQSIAYTVGAAGGSGAQGGAIRIRYTIDTSTPAAPSFDDATGDAVTWVSGRTIPPISVPQANGNPAPTYAVVGNLPTGIAFDATNVEALRITGAPVGRPSGTITIRATNSEGTADWTIDYSTDPAPPAGVLTETAGDGGTGSTFITFNMVPGFLIPASLVAGGATAYLVRVELIPDLGNVSLYTNASTVSSVFSGLTSGPELTELWEQYAEALTISAGGRNLVIPGPNAAGLSTRDSTEPYSWAVAEGAARDEFRAFHTAYRALSLAARNATTVTLRDGPLPVAPSWNTDTGPAITGVATNAIAPIIIPAVDVGIPDPTYEASGVPAGLAFNPVTRELSGTPAAAGTGTITITATNSAGSDTYTRNYAFTDPNQAPAVAIATQAQTVDGGAVVQLAAMASDADGTIVRQQWTAARGAFSNAAILGPTWTAPARTNQRQPITLRLTVTDDDGATAFAEVVITVRTNVLSDWVVPQGEEQACAAVIQVARNGDLRFLNGVILDGDLELTDNFAFDRVGAYPNPNRANFADAVGTAINARTLFAGSGDFSEGTIYVQDTAGVVGEDVADIPDAQRGGAGINVLQSENAELFNKVNGWQTGDNVIVAFTIPLVVRIAADFEAKIEGSSSLSITEPNSVRIAADFEASVIGDSRLDVVEPDAVRIAADFEAVVEGSSQLVVTNPVRISADFEVTVAGTSALSVVGPDAVRIAADFEATVAGRSELHLVLSSLDLSLFDRTRKTVDFAALIRRSSDTYLYADSSRLGTDSPVEGEVGFGSSETLISRIWWRENSWLEFNDDDSPSAANIGDYFGPSGAGHSQALYLITKDGRAGVRVADIYSSTYPGGGNSIQFGRDSSNPIPNDMLMLFNSIGVGDSFIIALAQSDPVRIAADFEAAVIGDSRLDVVGPDAVRIAADFEATVAGTSALSITEPDAVRIAADFEAVVAGSSQLGITQGVRIAADFEATVAGTSALSITEPDAVRIAADFEAVVAGSSDLSIAGPVRIAADFEAYVEGSSNLVIEVGVHRLRFNLNLGVPGDWLLGGVDGFVNQLLIYDDGDVELRLRSGIQFTTEALNNLQLSFGGVTVRGLQVGRWTPSNTDAVLAFYNSYDGSASADISLTFPQRSAEPDFDYQLVSPQPLGSSPPIDSMGAIGVTNRVTLECLVEGIRSINDLSAEVFLVPLSNAIHDAETGPIPPYDPKLTVPYGLLPQLLEIPRDGLPGADAVEWFNGNDAPTDDIGDDGDFYLQTSNSDVWEKRNGSWVVVASFKGAQGATWFTGPGQPAASLGGDGDYYFQTSDASIWRKDAGVWTYLVDIDGADGATWHSASGVPASTLGKLGDFYFRTDQGYVYEKIGTMTWMFLYDLTGPQGIRGATWHTGAGNPLPRHGVDGDLWFNHSNSTVWSKAGGVWSQIADLAGADGATWYSGSGIPSNSLGNNGDWYFRTSTATIWRKASGTWFRQVDIDGADGADGATWYSGSGAPSASLGRVGDWYFRTSNGWVYQKTSNFVWTFRRDITGPQGPQGDPAEIPGAIGGTRTIPEGSFVAVYTAPVGVTPSSGTYTTIAFTYTQTGASSIRVGSALIPYATSSRTARVAISSEGGTSRSDPIFLYAYWSARVLYIGRSGSVTLSNATFQRAAIIQTTS